MFLYRPEDPLIIRLCKEVVVFVWKNAISCLFPVYIFSLLLISKHVYMPFLYSYDFLLLACLLMQAIMVVTRLETKDELLVITLFHLLGLAMEMYKVQHGA